MPHPRRVFASASVQSPTMETVKYSGLGSGVGSGVAVGSAVGAAEGSGVSSGPEVGGTGVSLAAGASVSARSALFTETARTATSTTSASASRQKTISAGTDTRREGRCCMAYLPCYSVKWMWLLM